MQVIQYSNARNNFRDLINQVCINFEEFIEDSAVINKSITNNLQKAANLVKSFKQVAVDQSSDENREFNLKEYVDEILTSIQNETKKTKHNIIVDIPKNIKNIRMGLFNLIK